ncbi:unnamed protein product [Cochlearia groenlandica]
MSNPEDSNSDDQIANKVFEYIDKLSDEFDLEPAERLIVELEQTYDTISREFKYFRTGKAHLPFDSEVRPDARRLAEVDDGYDAYA